MEEDEGTKKSERSLQEGSPKNRLAWCTKGGAQQQQREADGSFSGATGHERTGLRGRNRAYQRASDGAVRVEAKKKKTRALRDEEALVAGGNQVWRFVICRLAIRSVAALMCVGRMLLSTHTAPNPPTRLANPTYPPHPLRAREATVEKTDAKKYRVVVPIAPVD